MEARRVEPGPGQESVWDYPRPPRLERVASRLAVTLGGVTIAATTNGLRVLETSHPPVYYFPPEDIAQGALQPTLRRSFCEFKGSASYWTVVAGSAVEPDAAWSYSQPAAPYQAMAGHVAFYCGRMDRCTVGDEVAKPQPGGFYGGWVTSTVAGPFKGEPGTMGW
jgi:uncharacterized protein (DUF427 family)